jgi:hypothetical protein
MEGIKAQHSIKMETVEQDKRAITDALGNFYFKGIYEGNVLVLKQAFYEGTLVFGDIKGQPYAKSLDQYLDGVKNRQSPKEAAEPFKGEIISIKVVNSIAIAEVRVKMYEFDYYDILSLHKIGGKWLIVNKMLTDVNL